MMRSLNLRSTQNNILSAQYSTEKYFKSNPNSKIVLRKDSLAKANEQFDQQSDKLNSFFLISPPFLLQLPPT